MILVLHAFGPIRTTHLRETPNDVEEAVRQWLRWHQVLYERVFGLLWEQANTGGEATDLIRAALLEMAVT